MRSVAVLVLLIGCTGKDKPDSQVTFEGPVLEHTPATAGQQGTDLPISVTATDDDGVRSVTLYWRSSIRDWTAANLSPGENNTWTTAIPAAEVLSPEIAYYFKATDAAAPAASSYLPEETTDAPFTVPISVQGAALPYTTSFEDVRSLVELGWHAASSGANGYGWSANSGSAADGSQSAWHPRGNPEAGLLQDWLISPALDLSSVDKAQVSWQESGTSVDGANHQLFIGVGDADPTDGGYELVSALPAPSEGAWDRSKVYDLSAWAGKPEIYLAWYFEGENSDDWFIDSVAVEQLKPDIEIGVTAGALSPGGDGTVTVTLDNGTSLEASDLTVELSFPSGGASVPGSSTATVAGNSSTPLDFVVSVAAETRDNAYLPVHVAVHGDEGDWSYDGNLLVGEASTASVTWTALLPGTVALAVGNGDPDAPAWETDLYAGDASANLSLSTDITAESEMLPPVAGSGRWYLRVDSEAVGTVDAFTIHYDGQDYTVGPYVLSEGEEKIIYLPEPPNLQVLSFSASSTLKPGDTGVPVSVSVRNLGAATQDVLQAELVSLDTDLVVSSGGPVAISSGIVNRNGVATGSSVFTVDVSATHTDSSDVAAELHLTDGVDSWVLPVSLAVPYPVPKITDIEIDDGADGILDAGETAQLTLSVTDVGDLSFSGSVKGVLTVESSSTATTTVLSGSQVLGILSAGSTKDGRFDVQVDAGASPGQTVDLLLTLNDSNRSYEARTTLTLGEPPWRSLDANYDSSTDALDGWDFDLVSGEYRVYNGYLQIRLVSSTTYNPDTLFIEAWGSSTGSAYSYYQIVLQSNIATLRAYDGNFTDIGTPLFSYPSKTEVEIDVPIADMALAQDKISLGFASGWCGDPDYCDQYPDYWGYPYTGWSPSLWFDLSW